MNEGARQANEWAWRNRVGSQLRRIIELLERLVLANLAELSPEQTLSPDGENGEATADD